MSYGSDSPIPAGARADPAATGSAARRSLWHLPAMRLLAVYTITGFTGFFATMSALPAWIAAQGTSDSLAGFVTTTLLAATVGAQSMVPRMMASFGMTATLAIGLAALGAPSLLFLVDGGYWWVLAICALRGIGFGSMTVIGAMLTARIVPPARRGEAIGIYGLAIAVPNLLAVPGGVALVSAHHFWLVAVLGAAPLLGLPVVRALSKAAAGYADSPPAEGGSGTNAALSSAARRRARRAARAPPSARP
jgi:MFS family permease